MTAIEASQVELFDGEELVELRRGAWAVLRDPEDVPESKRRPITDLSVEMARYSAELQTVREEIEANGGDASAIPASRLPSDAIERVNKMNDLLAVALIDRWSYDFPVSIDGLLSIPGRDYDTLKELTAPRFSDVMPNFGPSGGTTKDEETGELVKDDASPTGP